MPHAYQTNINAFAESLTETINSFGFTSTHEARALGELIVDNIIDGIRLRSTQQQCGGDGIPWPLNSDRTRRRKYREGREALVNIDTGQMLSAMSLRGTTTISQFEVRMEYGTGTVFKPPDRLRPTQRIRITGGVAKEEITDVDKATFAYEQHRSFYELDDTICRDNFQSFNETLAAHLANPGR